MTNHLHLLVSGNEPFQLYATIRDFKRHTAKAILNLIYREPEYRKEHFGLIFPKPSKENSTSGNKFWKSGNHAIEIYSSKFLRQKLNYIHQNPVVKDYVKKPEHWVYSSASNYLGEPSILPEVEVISLFNN